jgi:DNA mismatch repair ATPase MutS
MTIDDSQLVGSMSEYFLNEVYLDSREKLKTNGGRYMQYAYIDFIKHPTTYEPVMQLSIRYNNSAGSVYIARWRYRYELNDDNTITFFEREQTGSSNERLREQYLKSFVDYFCELEYQSYSTSSWNNTIISNTIPKTFKIDWAQNNTLGSIDMLGALIPINDKNNYCVGILAK